MAKTTTPLSPRGQNRRRRRLFFFHDNFHFLLLLSSSLLLFSTTPTMCLAFSSSSASSHRFHPSEDELSRVRSAKFISCPGWRLNAHPELKKLLKRDVEKRVRFGEKVSVEWQNGSPVYLEFLDEDGAKVNDLKRNVEQLSVEEISDILGKFGFHDIDKRFRDDAHVVGFVG